jgi:hypothetical protein
MLTGEVVVPGISSIDSAEVLRTLTDVDCCVNNLGIIPQLSPLDDLLITDVLELPHWKIEPWSSGFHRVYTYDGQLSVTSFYPDSRFTGADAAQILEILTAQLSSIAGSPIAVG